MISFTATSKANEFLELVAGYHPQINEVLREAGRLVADRSQAIRKYQAALLYLFAAQYNGQTIVELGTRLGYSTAILSMAAPDARIFTVDTNFVYLQQARDNLEGLGNIEFIHMPSWDFASKANDGKVSMVFVDANHERVKQDLAWWPKLRPGGLMLFHDYSSRFPAVIETVDQLAAIQSPGASPDIVCIGGSGHGMAGVYRQ